MLQSRLERAASLGIKVYIYNGEEDIQTNKYDQFIAAIENSDTITDANWLMSHIGVAFSNGDGNISTLQQHTINLDIDQLKELGETNYQIEFNEINKVNKFILFTHASNSDCPFFMDLQLNWYSMSAKPDNLMKKFPAIIEFKHTLKKKSNANAIEFQQHTDAESTASDNSKALSTREKIQDFNDSPNTNEEASGYINDDWDVLQQTMSRLLTTANLNALLKVMVGFSITSRHCYVLVFQRWFDDHRHLHQKITIVKINVATVCELWRNLSYLGEPSTYFMNDDYISIYQTIKLLGYPPEYCRITLVGFSISRVYCITFPGWFDRFLGIEEGKIDLAIKICLNDRKGIQEINCLRTVAKSIQATKSQFQNESKYNNFEFYARGAVDGDRIDWFDANRMIVANIIPQLQNKFTSIFEDGDVWWRPQLDHDLLCNTIIMDCGLPLKPSKEYYDEILNDIQTSLYFIHNAGLVHCDIRKYNIIKFTTGWQLVDFDYARRVNGEILIDLESNQYKASGQAVHSLASGINPELNIKSYNWRIDDDYQMLSKLLQDLLH